MGEKSFTAARRIRWAVGFALLLLALALFFVWSLMSGSVALRAGEVLSAVLSGGGSDLAADVIWKIRLPRLLAGMVLGGALALSGYLLQVFFHNPIAGPFVLGISSGAKLTVALALIFVLRQHRMASAAFLILAAFAGAMLSMAFVLLMARRVRGMSMLVISGMMIGYICSAITDFVVTFASDADIVNLHNWSMGSFSGMSWDNVRVMTAVVAAAGVGSFLLAKPIGAFQMGEDYAQSVGFLSKRCGIFWCCFPVCCRPVWQPLPGRCLLWALRCLISCAPCSRPMRPLCLSRLVFSAAPCAARYAI